MPGDQINNQDIQEDTSRRGRLIRLVRAYRICMDALAQLHRSALCLISDTLKKSDEKRIEELRNSLKRK